MDQQIRLTGIDAIDDRVKKIMQLPKRPNILDAPFDEDFPGRPEIIFVGAGWDFVFHAIAFVAAGAKITAYEMNSDRLGVGQYGMNMTDETLNFYRAGTLAHLMPDFTSKHLGSLPGEIGNIMNLPCYRALSEKRRSIISKGLQAYIGLPDDDKMSKKEVVETKRSILEHMIAVGVLDVIYEEVTGDMVTSWLKKNKPVFLLTGYQVNLEKSALNDLVGKPRFLKEFVLHSEDTKKFIKRISDLQRAHAATEISSSTLPRVGIIGGGEIALGCELDLGKILQPNLEIVSIAPAKRLSLPDSLLPAARSMKHQFVPGYVSELVLCEDKNVINSVKITPFPGHETRDISTSLFVHIHNDDPPAGKWGTPFRDAMNSITNLLDERAPGNGLIRDYAIGPKSYEQEITFRITEPFDISLEEDVVLIEKIKLLVEQDPGQATIVTSGSSPLVNRLIWLAASLGYRGQFFQVVFPTQHEDGLAVQFREELNLKGKFLRRPIEGRLTKAKVNGEKLNLEVHDSNGEPMSDVPDVDFLVNGLDRTKKTRLINELIEKGYIHENDVARDGPGIHSGHPMLSGHHTIFQRELVGDIVTSPGMRWIPWTTSPKTQPHGWEEVFYLARKMLKKCN